MKSDAGWIPEFRARFDAWWRDAEALIVAHEYGKAFRTYPWPVFRDTPWTPPTRPLAESRVAMVTTAGLYRPSVDAPFRAPAPDGDATFRTIPADVAPSALAIAHDHFPHGPAEADLDTVFPLALLHEAAAERLIGSVAPTHYSIMGYAPRADEVATVSAPAIAAHMRAEAVDVALVVPV